MKNLCVLSGVLINRRERGGRGEAREMTTADELNRITEKIIEAAIEVHRALGPGLLESTYEACLVYELVQRGCRVEQQKPLPVVYKEVQLDIGYRLDLLVDGKVVVELKTVEQLLPIHEAQLLSYLRLSGCTVGLLINFNVPVLRQGVRRLVNHFPEGCSSRRRRSE